MKNTGNRSMLVDSKLTLFSNLFPLLQVRRPDSVWRKEFVKLALELTPLAENATILLCLLEFFKPGLKNIYCDAIFVCCTRIHNKIYFTYICNYIMYHVLKLI